MDTVSISQLKVNPSKIIKLAADFPVAVENRNEVEGYVIGKGLFEKIEVFLENMMDIQAIKKADFSKKRNFEDLAKELGI